VLQVSEKEVLAMLDRGELDLASPDGSPRLEVHEVAEAVKKRVLDGTITPFAQHIFKQVIQGGIRQGPPDELPTDSLMQAWASGQLVRTIPRSSDALR
jgi:hypothetical protein